jgi:hypothetical protein
LRAHVRHFQVAGMTIRVESDLPITDSTFGAALKNFETEQPGDDIVVVRHHFLTSAPIPGFAPDSGLRQAYRRPPWAIYRTKTGWLYLGIGDDSGGRPPGLTASFDRDHSSGDIYGGEEYASAWSAGGLTSLTLFTTDQILLARLLARRQGCLLHSAGLVVDGRGLLFVGHAEAGKSTTARLLSGRLGSRATILCDDRNAVRRWPEGFRGGPGGFYAHGTWSHGDVSDVSAGGAPLRAVMFLEQAASNEVVPLADHRLVWRRLLATLIRPLATPDWWEQELDVLEALVASVPFYTMRFDTSGEIVHSVEALLS